MFWLQENLILMKEMGNCILDGVKNLYERFKKILDSFWS